MTAISSIEATRRKLASSAETLQALPERLGAAWKESLNDSARDIAIGWRVHRKPVSARPIVQRHFHERLLKTRRLVAAEMDVLRRMAIAAIDDPLLQRELQKRWPASDLDAFPFLDSSAILTDVALPLPRSLTPGIAERHALDELRRRYEPLFATPLRSYGMRLRDWARRRLQAIEGPFTEIALLTREGAEEKEQDP